MRERILRRVLDRPDLFSRNRNFHAYTDAEVNGTARIGRILRGLKQDLLEGEWRSVTLEDDADNPDWTIVTVIWPSAKRVCRVRSDELRILCEDAELAGILDEARG